MATQHDKSLQALRRKLEAWELEHLRQHCAEQAQRIEELEREHDYLLSVCDQWQREAEALREHLDGTVHAIQLGRDGSISVGAAQ